ncbi:MAG: late competence development ComFB family protein [Clostridia bacterium]|nr:late competence development ComFB family protein [Clostridia bacterium]
MTKPMLKNYMEDIVWGLLDEVLKNFSDVCTCENCRYDIAAITLNSLKPKYGVTRIGEVFSRAVSLEPQYRADVISAITKAVVKVKDNPKHS